MSHNAFFSFKRILRQFFSFLAVSGVGFLIDFAVYYYLTTYMQVPIAYGNMISAVPAITWVFLFSTRKIFRTTRHSCSLPVKYAIYLCYQAVLLIFVSYLAQWLYGILYPLVENIGIISRYLNLVCKCIITPITMTSNFLVMKFLAERI